MKQRRYLVIGLGNFGGVVVSELVSHECNVTAIDTSQAKLEALPKHSHLDAIVADATDRALLERLQVDQYDAAVVSTGENWQSSILIAMHLKELGARKIMVKANTDDHARILKMVGATETVIPEQQMAAKLARSIAHPNLVDFLPLSRDFVVAELSAPDAFLGQTLAELKLRSRYNVFVLAVKKNTTGELDLVPGGDYIIRRDDLLVIVGRTQDIDKLRK
jgi:trk system potassium uptake protein TrkA